MEYKGCYLALSCDAQRAPQLSIGQSLHSFSIFLSFCVGGSKPVEVDDSSRTERGINRFQKWVMFAHSTEPTKAEMRN